MKTKTVEQVLEETPLAKHYFDKELARLQKKRQKKLSRNTNSGILEVKW